MTASRPQIPLPTFDLEAYAANYTGPLLIYRLAHITTYCPLLASQALPIALRTAQKAKDVNTYRRLVELGISLGLDVELDKGWLARQEDANKRELQRLEGELRGYKNNLIRESIRMGQEDLATHLLLTGGTQRTVVEEGASSTPSGLATAYTAFGKMRDYCTTPTHVAGMSLRLLYTSFVQAVEAQQLGSSGTPHYASANAHATRLRSVGVKAEEQVLLTPISAAALGVAYLGQGLYKEAAQCFLDMDIKLATNDPVQGFDFCRTIATANDLAIYGGLTALATLTRAELESDVLNGTLRPYLELEPHMRKSITLFTNGKYRACLDTLARYYADWSLDVFLGAGIASADGSHVDRLLNLVREKSIIAYFTSFSQVSLASLAATFPSAKTSTSTPEDTVTQELITMIEEGRLSARLDVVNSALVALQHDRRIATQAAAIETADDIERTLLERLYKVNISLAQLEIAKPKGQPQMPLYT